MIKHATGIVLAVLSIYVVAAHVDAKPRYHVRHRTSHHLRNASGTVVCNKLGCSDRPGRGNSAVVAASAFDANGNATVVGRRPAGCPYEYCGCEASLYLFGTIRPRLNVARNWRVFFPRTGPAPGMAAVRTHHVMVLMSHVRGDRWLVHDGNFGHVTREHIVSIRGYTIVDPHRGRFASSGLTAQASVLGN